MKVFEKLKNALGIYTFKANAMLKDGTEIVVDGDLDVGVSVSVVTPDGNKPLPDGTYQLEDGTTIIVEGGLIKEITEPTEDPVEEVEEATDTEDPPPAGETPPSDEGGVTTPTTPTPTEEPNPEDVEPMDVEEEVKKLNDRIAVLEQAVASMMSSQENLTKEKEEFSKQFKELELKLSKMDGAEPLKKRKIEINDGFELSKNTSQRLKNLGLTK